VNSALVIGAAGFVGGYLTDELLRAHGRVFVTKLPNETIQGYNCEVIDLDILNGEALQLVLSDIHPETIYHLAAQSSVALSWKKPQLTADINIKGAINLLEAITSLDYQPRILLVGSGEEYGAVRAEDCPIKETLPVNPQNVYALTKAAQNQLGTLYASAYGMDVILTRAFNHIGPGQSTNFVVADFCRQVAEIKANMRGSVIKVGNLAAKRDFTDVRDVVQAYIALAEKGQSGQTYNIGSGKALAIEEILDMIISIAQVELEVRIDPERFRPVDVPIIEADITKLQEATGWKPEIPLGCTLAEILESFACP
jgi:GDP-4-dehydro-6-deoxy-D-mannose reductase